VNPLAAPARQPGGYGGHIGGDPAWTANTVQTIAYFEVNQGFRGGVVDESHDPFDSSFAVSFV